MNEREYQEMTQTLCDYFYGLPTTNEDTKQTNEFLVYLDDYCGGWH